MQITNIEFNNYRNLNNLTIQFPTDISFIIGENGIGKSNILNALSKIFIYGKFADYDFTDSTKEIIVHISLALSDEEIGSFDEYTDPSNPNKINLVIKQEIDDTGFSVYHLETGEEISPRLLKNVYYIYYDSLRNPRTELSFEKDKGSGSFLNFIIKYFLEKHDEADEAYVNKEKLSEILTFINSSIGDLRTVKRNNSLVEKKYSSGGQTEKSLLVLLKAFLKNLQEEYKFLDRDEKVSYIVDILSNRSLKQSMEYIDSRVILSTVHGAKGLEWDCVIVRGLKDYSFPSFTLCGKCNRHKYNFGECQLNMESLSQDSDATKNYLEELSVFYVAATRARKRLCMTTNGERINNRDQIYASQLSCFLRLPGIVADFK